MKLTSQISVLLLSLFFLAGPALAGDSKSSGEHHRMHEMDHGKGDKKHMGHNRMRMMEMMRETMSIVANLNHMPSDADKQKLNAMIQELDEMMKNYREHMDRRAEKKGK